MALTTEQRTPVVLADKGSAGGVTELDTARRVPGARLGNAFRVVGGGLSGAGSQTAEAGVHFGMVGVVPAVHFASGTANFSVDHALTTIERNINGAVDTEQKMPALRIVDSGVRDIFHFRKNNSIASRGRINFGEEWKRDFPRFGAFFNYTMWGPDLPAQAPGEGGGNKTGFNVVIKFDGGFTGEASKNVVDPKFVFGANDFIVTGKNAGAIAGLENMWGRLTETHLYAPGSSLISMHSLVGEAAIEETATGSTIQRLVSVQARGARIRANVTVDAHYSLFVTASERIGAPGEAATVTRDRSLYVQSGVSEFGGNVLFQAGTVTDGTTSVAYNAPKGVHSGFTGGDFGVGFSTGGSTFHMGYILNTFQMAVHNAGVDKQILNVNTTTFETTFKAAATVEGVLTTKAELYARSATRFDGTISIAANAPSGVRLGYTGSDFAVGWSTGASTVHAGYTGNTFQIAAHNSGVDRQLLTFDTSAFKTTIATAVQLGRTGQTDVLTLNQASSSSASAGGASALPSAPAEYVTVTTPNGTRKIPLYAA